MEELSTQQLQEHNIDEPTLQHLNQLTHICQHILKKGRRIGQICGKDLMINGQLDFCSIHWPLNIPKPSRSRFNQSLLETRLGWVWQLNLEPEIMNLGLRVISCNFCGAVMWKGEQLQNGWFSICCSAGKVQLPLLHPLPGLFDNLLNYQHPLSSSFMKNIVAYNSVFAFASLGAKIGHQFQRGRTIIFNI